MLSLTVPGLQADIDAAAARDDVFDRHPTAMLVLGHMAEFLPFMRSRLDSRYATIDPQTPLQRMPSASSGVFSPATLTGAVLEIGADAVMFSVDYPYERILRL